MPTVQQAPAINPLVAQSPDYQALFLKAQRQQRMAEALTQQGLDPIQYDHSGAISWTQGLAKVLSSYMGSKEGEQADQAMANANAAGYKAVAARFGLGQPQQPSANDLGNALAQQNQSDQSTPDQNQQGGSANLSQASNPQQSTSAEASPSPQDLASALTTPVQTSSSPTPPAPSQQAQPGTPNGTLGPDSGHRSPVISKGNSNPSSANSMVIPGMTGEQAFTAYMADPNAYVSEMIKRTDNRTDFTKTLLSMGIDPNSPVGQQMAGAWLAKQTYIEPTAIRAGSGIWDPLTGRITTMPSAPPEGFTNVQNPDGSWITVPVQGGTEAVTQSTAATEAGKAPYQLIDVYDPVTKTTRRAFVGNVLQVPNPNGGTSTPGQSSPTFQTSNPANMWRQLQTIRDPAERQRALSAFSAQYPQFAGGNDGGQPSTGPGTARGTGVQTGPALGEAQGATNAQNELSSQWTAQQQAHTTAQTNMALLQQIRGLADKAVTGYESDKRTYLKKLGSYVGIPGMDEKASSSDLLSKYGAQLITGLSSRGMSTDAARDIVMAGTPNSKMQPDAIREASDSLIAREQMTQARTRALMLHAINRDPAKYQATAAQFDQIADPRLWQLQNMSPQQVHAFTSNLNPRDAAALAQKYQAAKQMGYLQ